MRSRCIESLCFSSFSTQKIFFFSISNSLLPSETFSLYSFYIHFSPLALKHIVEHIVPVQRFTSGLGFFFFLPVASWAAQRVPCAASLASGSLIWFWPVRAGACSRLLLWVWPGANVCPLTSGLQCTLSLFGSEPLPNCAAVSLRAPSSLKKI